MAKNSQNLSLLYIYGYLTWAHHISSGFCAFEYFQFIIISATECFFFVSGFAMPNGFSSLLLMMFSIGLSLATRLARRWSIVYQPQNMVFVSLAMLFDRYIVNNHCCSQCKFLVTACFQMCNLDISIFTFARSNFPFLFNGKLYSYNL